MDMVALGAKIRRLRKDMGISQEALAERVGVSPVYICMVENGKRTMSLALLDRIANELETTVGELVNVRKSTIVFNSVERFTALIEDCTEYEEQVLLAMLIFMKSAIRGDII